MNLFLQVVAYKFIVVCTLEYLGMKINNYKISEILRVIKLICKVLSKNLILQSIFTSFGSDSHIEPLDSYKIWKINSSS